MMTRFLAASVDGMDALYPAKCLIARQRTPRPPNDEHRLDHPAPIARPEPPSLLSPAVIELDALDGSDGFALAGIDAYDFSGMSVADAGDVNGDGFADVIIGARTGDPGADESAGESYVVFGKAGGFAASMSLGALDGTNGFRLAGIDAYDQSGASVASAGDVNGDGFADVIIGAPVADPGGDASAGESYVVFGKAGGWTASFNLATLNGANGFRLDGIDADDLSGQAVSSAGDVNGDGFADIIVAAPYADANGDSDAGETYVVFGQASGFGAAIDLGGLNGIKGFRIDGIDAYDNAGHAVAGAGDINNDGFDDIIIGADSANADGKLLAGESYVVFGKVGGFAASLDLAALDGINGFRLDGTDIADISGYSVSSAGDFNADGFDDIIIGAIGGDPDGKASAGESYVVFGKAGGFAASIDLASLDGTNGFTLGGIDAGDNSGWSVSGCGDFNGDGFDDLIIGAPYADPADDAAINGPGGDNTGQAFVLFGSSGPLLDRYNFDDFGPEQAILFNGFDQFDLTGFSVSGGGDVNGDGLADAVIGAWRFDVGANLLAGQSYVVFGQFPDAAVNRTGTNIGQTIWGGAFGDMLAGKGGPDALKSQGGKDTLIGGSGADSLDGGGGIDVASYVKSALGIDIDLATGTGEGGDAEGDSFIEIENVEGSKQDDTIAGDAAGNLFIGKKGDDLLEGKGGPDTLEGGAGADTLKGGAGSDTASYANAPGHGFETSTASMRASPIQLVIQAKRMGTATSRSRI